MNTTVTVCISLLLLSGCASPSKIPNVDQEALPKVTFEQMKPRNLKLSVTNHKSIYSEKGNVKEVEAALKKSITDRLAQAGITVNDKSNNSLTFDFFDYENSQASKDACVKVHGLLLLKNDQGIQNEAFGCYTIKNILGMKLGSDIDKAYEQVISFLLDHFDKNLK